jgi:hypothetical protein
VNYTVRYTFTEFFPAAPPTVTDFPAGTVVPLIWILQNAQGKVTTNLNAILSVQIAPNSTCALGGEGPASNAKSLGNLGVQNTFGVYHFNLLTAGRVRGCYSILLLLDDDSTKTTLVRLR